jgi:hypothetical protein
MREIIDLKSRLIERDFCYGLMPEICKYKFHVEDVFKLTQQVLQ